MVGRMVSTVPRNRGSLLLESRCPVHLSESVLLMMTWLQRERRETRFVVVVGMCCCVGGFCSRKIM